MVFNIIKIRKSDDRFLSRRDWLHSMHSFYFADHRDPKWDNFGKIRVINEDIISPNAGFNTCLLYTSPSPRDRYISRMPSSA